MKRCLTPVWLIVLGIGLSCLSQGGVSRAAEADHDYQLPDDLKLVRIDSSAEESFFSVRGDLAGRLFVGGRHSLFVYEPGESDAYRPRRLLYQFPEHTWVNDIAIRGNDLYVLTVSALYVIPGGVTQRENLHIKRLLWGMPRGHVHQGFHALAWGPEGDLYLSMGDPVVSYGDFNRPDHWCHWTFFSQPDDTPTPYTGVGGVLRIRPDGSRLQVVARGMRNPCGLAFDQEWNLFSNDNDHESMPDLYAPGRVLHVTPYAEFFWPRGWMVEKTPNRAELLDTLFAGMGRAVPVGQAYEHDAFLPETYHNNLLIARWCTHTLARYPLTHRGASFQSDEQTLLSGRNDARPVGVCVARGGRIFVTVAHMAHNEGSPVYKSDLLMITRADDTKTCPFTAFDPVVANPDELWSALAHPAWTMRSAAQIEILRRGGVLLDEAVRRLKQTQPGERIRPHLVWLAAASGTQAAAEVLSPLATEDDSAIRLQALRALSESSISRTEREVVVAALNDRDPQVRHAALVACFSFAGEVPHDVLTGAARSGDSYLRQTSTLLLASKGTIEQIIELLRSTDSAGRLAGVLAAGFRLTVPPATQPIAIDKPLEKLAEDGAYLIEYADTRLDLRQRARIGNFTVAEHWHAGQPTAEQQRLFELLQNRLSDEDKFVQLQAAHFLQLLADERSEPMIAKVLEADSQQRLAVAPLKGIPRVWLAGPFADEGKRFQTIHPPETGPIDLAAPYRQRGQALTWNEVEQTAHYDLSKKFGPCDDRSFYAYFRLESINRQSAHLLIGSDDGVKVWHNGQEVWSNPARRAALPIQDTILLDLQPGSNDLLVRVQNEVGDCGLYLHYRALGAISARLPEKVGVDSLAERLKLAAEQDTTEVSSDFLTFDWSTAATSGNVANGRRLFEKFGCIKCHGITAGATGTGGPSLADARKRFTAPYLVESVLLPSKQVSPIFRRTLLVTEAGLTLTGLVVSEAAEKLELLEPDGRRKMILKAEISERQLQDVSPMPRGLIKTPSELQDVLAYLLSDNPEP